MQVVDYALKYDIPHDIDITYFEGHYYVGYTDAELKSSFRQVEGLQICKIPNIIKRNYEQKNFRLQAKELSTIFEQNCVELMQLVQNYDNKSDTTLRKYMQGTTNLWKLNRKHKYAYLMINYGVIMEIIITLLLLGGFAASFLTMSNAFHIVLIMFFVVCLLFTMVHCIESATRDLLDLKLPL